MIYSAMPHSIMSIMHVSATARCSPGLSDLLVLPSKKQKVFVSFKAVGVQVANPSARHTIAPAPFLAASCS